MGTAQIVMLENYIALFSVPDKQEAKAIVENAKPAMDARPDILLLAVVVQIVVVVLLAQEKWEKIYSLTMIPTLIPSFS